MPEELRIEFYSHERVPEQQGGGSPFTFSLSEIFGWEIINKSEIDYRGCGGAMGMVELWNMGTPGNKQNSEGRTVSVHVVVVNSSEDALGLASDTISYGADDDDCASHRGIGSVVIDSSLVGKTKAMGNLGDLVKSIDVADVNELWRTVSSACDAAVSLHRGTLHGNGLYYNEQKARRTLFLLLSIEGGHVVQMQCRGAN